MTVCLIDTSVLLNILNVPGLNRDHATVTEEFVRVVEKDASLLRPLATVVETGDHIARLTDGRVRRTCGEWFVATCLQALDDGRPWAMMLPGRDGLRAVLRGYPDDVASGRGLADQAIIVAWHLQCARWQCARWQCARWQCARWQCARWQCARWQCARWQCARWPERRAFVWSLDRHLQGYDHRP